MDKEDESIGNLCNSDELDLVMVSITLTDSIAKDQKKVDEKIINKLTSNCELHKGDKELNICVTCGIAFCDQCGADHKSHKTVNRSDLMKFSEELKETQENIQKNFVTLELTDSYSDTDICKADREELNMQCDKLVEMVDNIKKKSRFLYSDFKGDFDAIFPYLIEYKEKVESLYEDAKKETTVRLEKKFIDFYCKYINVRNHSGKINENLFSLKRKIENFKDLLVEFKTRVQSMSESISEQYLQIKDFKLSDDFNLNQELATNNNNNVKISQGLYTSSNNLGIFNSGDGKTNNFWDKRAMSEIRSSHFSSSRGFGRMNLVTLLSPPKDKKALVKMMEHQLKERKNTEGKMSSNNVNLLKGSLIKHPSKIDENNEDTDGDVNNNLYYNAEVKTTNLVIFDAEKKQITRVKTNLNQCLFKKFEVFHSTLNYKGRFYISGGYTTGKMFYKLNKNLNEFIKLPDMPTKHAYHCLLGVGDLIFSISGYKTKKVEKYNIEEGNWISMPELENARSWSSCINIDDKYIFVFGGLLELPDGRTNSKLVEKLDITTQNSKWEILEVKSDIELSFYFGVLKINKEKILLLGGKFDPKEDNTDQCFSYSFDTNTMVIEDDYKLPNKDEFDGKLFIDLGDSKYGQFSAIYSDLFYMVDLQNKNIEIIKPEQSDSNQK